LSFTLLNLRVSLRKFRYALCKIQYTYARTSILTCINFSIRRRILYCPVYTYKLYKFELHAVQTSEREANNSLPPSTKVKTVWSCISIPLYTVIVCRGITFFLLYCYTVLMMLLSCKRKMHILSVGLQTPPWNFYNLAGKAQDLIAGRTTNNTR